MSDIQEQRARTEAARKEAAVRAEKKHVAWELWHIARAAEADAFAAYKVESRKLEQMKETLR